MVGISMEELAVWDLPDRALIHYSMRGKVASGMMYLFKPVPPCYCIFEKTALLPKSNDKLLGMLYRYCLTSSEEPTRLRLPSNRIPYHANKR